MLKQTQQNFKSSDKSYIDSMINQYSPFNMNLDLERERSEGVNSFLPSYHQHKSNILKGKSSVREEEEDTSKKGSSYQRSATHHLLGNIKDPAADNKAGVVPKDIGLGLISDLIDDDSIKEMLEDNGYQKKKSKFKK